MSCYLGSERGSEGIIWVLGPSVIFTNPWVSGSFGNSQGEFPKLSQKASQSSQL